jgi:hypothetical protein
MSAFILSTTKVVALLHGSPTSDKQIDRKGLRRADLSAGIIARGGTMATRI